MGHRTAVTLLIRAAVGAAFFIIQPIIAPPAQAAGTLIWGMPSETDTLDPHATGGWTTYQVTYQT